MNPIKYKATKSESSKWKCSYWKYEWFWIPKFNGPYLHGTRENHVMSTIKWLCFIWEKHLVWYEAEFTEGEEHLVENRFF